MVLPVSHSVQPSLVDICDSLRIHVLSIRLSFIRTWSIFMINLRNLVLESCQYFFISKYLPLIFDRSIFAAQFFFNYNCLDQYLVLSIFSTRWLKRRFTSEAICWPLHHISPFLCQSCCQFTSTLNRHSFSFKNTIRTLAICLAPLATGH